MRPHPASALLRNGSALMLHRLMLADLRDGENDWRKDPRDLMVMLAPYLVCAHRIGPTGLIAYGTAAHRAPEALRETVARFGKRDDVTLKAFGYDETLGPNGPQITRSGRW